MAGQRDEELRMTPRLSTSPEPKRSKPWENSGIGGEIQQTEESAEVKNRRLRRELMAAAAEKRLAAVKSDAPMVMKNVECVKDVKITEMPMEEAEVDPTTEMKSVEGVANLNVVSFEGLNKGKSVDKEKVEPGSGASYTLSATKADQLFLMIFGSDVSKNVLTQWCNQGISFSPDPETLMGLVQHEGGPCGVLAAIQAFVLKYLIFSAEGSDNATQNMPSGMFIGNVPNNESVAPDIFSSLSTAKRSRALIRSMTEILFLCGHNERAVIASLNIVDGVKSSNGSEDEFVGKALGSLYIESGSDLQKALSVDTCTSMFSAVQKLEAMLPIFRSRYGALLFLISALLSRGLDNVQEDRDDPSQSLVTAPFGHASQEIVNLLLSGCAVANVFDGRMDLGGGMFVKGISTSVEVGFLTLLESLNFCKVGHYLKCPRWPIWVVGSESHYTVLFALDTRVQEENELENRERRIRRAFDSQDQSGGGGFISVEGFQRVIHETNINFPPEKIQHLCGMGFIVWSEFWQALLELDKSSGGVKDSTGLMGKKVFDLYHFNGIAKSVSNGGQGYGNESPIQRPRLTKLRVSVPPKWTPEEFMADIPPVTSDGVLNSGESAKPQHAPLVDCIRTRWPRAVCNWEGDAPSIV